MTGRPLHIGLIGGIGVAATLVYYRRLTAAVAAKGGSLKMTIAHADAGTLVSNNRADRRAEQAEVFAGHLAELERAGCDCATITSLGGHFCFEETVSLTSLPLVSAITPLDPHFRAVGLARVGLLGTSVVMRSRLYGQLTQTEAVAPDGEIDAIGQAYQDMAIAGVCTPAQRDLFVNAGRRLIEEQDAQAVALVGTDMNLAFDGIDPGYLVVDAVNPHVAMLADLALGAVTLDEVSARGRET